MSLDIRLEKRITASVYDTNITHNLVNMAMKAGIYKFIWCPESLGLTRAGQLIKPLEKGLSKLKRRPRYFKQFNPENGWGNYDILVDFVERYLDACLSNKTARVKVNS